MEAINITLFNEKAKSVIKIIKVLLLTHVIIFTGAWINHKISFLPLLIVAPLTLLFFIYPNAFNNKVINPPYLIIILVLAWIALGVYWMVAFCIILFVFSVLSLKKVMLTLSENGVLMASMLLKKYQWGDFNNIIMKDNIITLDFKNNRILQSEIQHTIVSEEFFNNFVHQYLVVTS